MNFAERNGVIEPKSIQSNYMDEALRNRLYNITMQYLSPSPELNKILEFVVDKLGFLCVYNSEANAQVFNMQFLNYDMPLKNVPKLDIGWNFYIHVTI